MIKTLRSQKKMSQEALAESSGLSLRTIQRVEAGHRISYRYLRALSKVFNMDVDNLEWELYAMKNSNEFIEKPLWVRLVLGLPILNGLNKAGLLRHEASLVLYALFAYGASFLVPTKQLGVLALTTIDALYFSAFSALFLAYISSITYRVRDVEALHSSVQSEGGI